MSDTSKTVIYHHRPDTIDGVRIRTGRGYKPGIKINNNKNA